MAKKKKSAAPTKTWAEQEADAKALKLKLAR